MKTWLLRLWDDLRTNFWFVPTVMVVLALGLSFVTIQLDKITKYRSYVAALGWTFTRGPEGSRAVLSVVAGSMMTISSISFSITIVVLQLASSQFGPRLLRNFVRDRGNQVVLGTFIATFTYCLLILRTINSGSKETQAFTPNISVTIGILLALASLGVLIFFIHHVATSIQADSVIAGVSHDLHAAIGSLFPEMIGDEQASAEDDASEIPASFDELSRPIRSPRSDYVQAVDEAGLMAIAVEHDLVLRLERRPGQFVMHGSCIALAWPAERVDDETAARIVGLFYFGDQRTMVQDAEFAVDQLVEIAVRAMSPGINDPFTAITCIDRLGSALCHLASRRMPSRYRVDDEGRLRLIANVTDFDGMADAAFNQVRQASRQNTAVTIRLLETIGMVARSTEQPGHRLALLGHAVKIHRGSQEGIADESDRRDVDSRYQAVATALEVL